MKKFIVFAFALFAVSIASAQEFRWGPTAAFNLSWLHGVKSVNSSDCYVGFNLGIKAERDFSDLITDGFYLDDSIHNTDSFSVYLNRNRTAHYLFIGY